MMDPEALRFAADCWDYCGGEIPPETSDAYEAGDDYCPGHLAHDDDGNTIDRCGAFQE